MWVLRNCIARIATEGFHTTWKVGAPEVASVVVGIDAGCGGKLAGPRKIFFGIISLVESVL
jgi:hypothetical protein